MQHHCRELCNLKSARKDPMWGLVKAMLLVSSESANNIWGDLEQVRCMQPSPVWMDRQPCRIRKVGRRVVLNCTQTHGGTTQFLLILPLVPIRYHHPSVTPGSQVNNLKILPLFPEFQFLTTVISKNPQGEKSFGLLGSLKNGRVYFTYRNVYFTCRY